MAFTKIKRLFAVSVYVLIFAAFASAQDKDGLSPAVIQKCGMAKEELDPLIDEAERNQFNTRRVEIAGSTYTRDREFRKRMTDGLHEGDIFTRGSLEESVKRISKMKAIYPITMANVKVRLDRRDKSIDIIFCVRQKPKR